jgi:hypothetical protein
MAGAKLTGFTNIETGLFVRMEFPRLTYRTSATANYNSTQVNLTFSDYNRPVYIYNDELEVTEEYLPLGNLVGITSLENEMRASNSPVTMTISGIPDTSIAEVVHSRTKGCKVKIFRGLFDPDTGNVLTIPGSANPFGRFTGFVENFSIAEDFQWENGVNSHRVTFELTSNVELLAQKIAGRQTNPESYRYSNRYLRREDPSMDRIVALVGANFDFGKPRE